MRKMIAIALLIVALAGLVYGVLGITTKTVAIKTDEAEGVYNLVDDSYEGQMAFSGMDGFAKSMSDLKKLAQARRNRQIGIGFGVCAVFGVIGASLLLKKNTDRSDSPHPVQEAKEVNIPDTSLTPKEERQNIVILTQNRVKEFSQNNIRGEAADELGKSKNPEAVAALLDAVENDPARNVRGRALTALSEIALSGAGAPEVNREIFFVSLNDPERYVVECAAEALGRLKEKRAIEPLLNIILAYREGQDFSAAKAAINALGEIGEDAVPVLLKELENNPAKREVLLRALAATGSPSAFEVLQKAMADQTLPAYERQEIAKGLAKIGTPGAVESLKNALNIANDEGLVKTIVNCLEDMNVKVKDLEAKKKAAEIKAAKKLLKGLKTVRVGMTEDQADDLVGPGHFQMGANVVHNTRFGSFQLLVSGNRVVGTLYTEGVIQNIEKWLKEQK